MSILNKIAKMAKKADYLNKGINPQDADFLEFQKFLEEYCQERNGMVNFNAAIVELYELGHKRPYGKIFEELAKILHNSYERKARIK